MPRCGGGDGLEGEAAGRAEIVGAAPPAPSTSWMRCHRRRRRGGGGGEGRLLIS